MAYYEDDYQYDDWYDRDGRDGRCGRCDRCGGRRCDDHKPEPPKKQSAQFVNTEVQEVRTPAETPVNFNQTVVAADKGITLEPPNSIRLERGRYLVAYYLTIKNKDNDPDTFIAKLKLGLRDIPYTTSRVRIDNNEADIGNLGKTNLIEVCDDSLLKLIVSSPDNDVKYEIQDASIVIERID